MYKIGRWCVQRLDASANPSREVKSSQRESTRAEPGAPRVGCTTSPRAQQRRVDAGLR